MKLLFDPVLLPVTLPAVAGVLCYLLPRLLSRLRSTVTLGFCVASLFYAWNIFTEGSRIAIPVALERWLRVDSLSAFVLVAVAFFGVIIALYSLGFMHGHRRGREYDAYLLWTLAASCGVVLANDLVLLLVFWGVLGLTLYMLIGIAGPEAAGAAKKTFIIIGGSDCLLLLGVAMYWALTGSSRMDQAPLALLNGVHCLAFLCFVVGAFAKAGAMPFHTWVPDCGEKAPVPVAAFLPASLDKLLGIYLLTRTAVGTLRTAGVEVNVGLFQLAPGGPMNTLLMLLGSITIVFAVMMALVQHDLKRLLSYHAVSQVGYMVVGIASGTTIGILGGLFHMLNNTIYKSCLFLCAGAVEKRTGTTDLDKLGGLAKAMPVTFFACFVAALSISGVPPLNGFVSKWMVYQGIIEAGKQGCGLWTIWLTAAMIGSAMTLASFVKLLHATFLCKPSAKLRDAEIHEVGFAMWLPMLVLAFICVVFGVAAYRLPLELFIAPVAKIEISTALVGTWFAGPATLMLAVAFLSGLLVYWLTRASALSPVRECETYVGGESLEDTYISDGGSAELESSVEVTGVDFYRTVQNLWPLGAIYRAAGRKFFDLYDVGTKVLFYFVEALRKAHTGQLPMYLTWVLAGLLALCAVLLGNR